MSLVTDQMGRLVDVPGFPRRIVSLVPSQTELLFDLGVGERVVGVTKFCVHPAEARKRAAIIGGTKNFDFEKIAALQPDLIIGNKEENYRTGIQRLAQDYPVWMSDIVTLGDALAMIRSVGELVNADEAARGLLQEIEQGFAALAERRSTRYTAPRALYLIWRAPWMGAGSGTFIHEMLTAGGFDNVLADQPRYPELSDRALADLKPDVVLLSSEPYPFKERHVAEMVELCPQANVRLVDGELFSWYGSRLRLTADYLSRLLEVL